MALGLVATYALVESHAGTDPVPCTAHRLAAEARSAMVTGAGDEVLVIGDSYSVGLGVRLNDSWPSRLPGRVRVDGFSGSGFSRGASACGDLSYAARAPHSVRDDTSLLVVEGGLNYHDQPAAEDVRGFVRLIVRLAGFRVYVIGTVIALMRADSEID